MSPPGDRITPPGPEGWPIVGNAIEFSSNPLQFLENCARNYADVVRIARRTYLVVHPDLVRQVLQDKDGTFVKVGASADDNDSAFPASVMNSAGADWQSKRRKLQPAFQKDLIHEHVERVSLATKALVATWRCAAPVRDTREDMRDLCMEVGSRFLFGASSGPDDTRRFAGMVDAIMMLKRSQLRIPSSIPTPGRRRLRKARQELDEALDGIIARFLGSPTTTECLLGSLLADAEGGMSAWVRDELATMVMSGLEPMAAGLTWTFYLLARHEEVQLELQREIDSAIGEGRAVVADDLPRLRLTEAVVKESLRLYPPAWMTGRMATRDCTLGGFHVPAKTMMAVSPWVNHRDPRHFDRPEDFRPQRWLDKEFVEGLPGYAYFPFGGGARKCIGTHLSMTQMVSIVASMVGGADLRLAPDAKVDAFPALVLRPTGVRLSVTARSRGPVSQVLESVA